MATSSHTGSGTREALGTELANEDLGGRRRREGLADAHVPGYRLGAEVPLCGEEPAKPLAIERDPGSQLKRRHDLVADDRVGDRVHRAHHDVGMALQDSDDRSGRKVLSVDPQPVVGPAGEPQIARLHPCRRGLPSSTSRCAACPGRLLRFPNSPRSWATRSSTRSLRSPPLRSRGGPTRRTRQPGILGHRRRQPGYPGEPVPERLLGCPGVLEIATPSFCRPVVLGDVTSEPSCETLDISRRSFVAEHEVQRVGSVIGLLRRRQHVRQRTPDVVEIGHAMFAHVREGSPTPKSVRRSATPSSSHRRRRAPSPPSTRSSGTGAWTGSNSCRSPMHSARRARHRRTPCGPACNGRPSASRSSQR